MSPIKFLCQNHPVNTCVCVRVCVQAWWGLPAASASDSFLPERRSLWWSWGTTLQGRAPSLTGKASWGGCIYVQPHKLFYNFHRQFWWKVKHRNLTLCFKCCLTALTQFLRVCGIYVDREHNKLSLSTLVPLSIYKAIVGLCILFVI